MSNDLFFITDGNDYVNLRSKQAGIFLQNWIPAIKEAKGGGTWQDSPLSDGRFLVAKPFGNAIEQLGLMVGNGGQDATIEAVQTLRRLLQKAVNYSLTDWQTEPVWMLARARYESNVRYALIYDYRAPGDNNPFAEPFDSDTPLVTNFPLILERSDWFSNPPGETECLPLSTLIGSDALGAAVFYTPEAYEDDASVNTLVIFSLNNPYITIGNQLSQPYRSGIRFPGVEIPQGATIVSAVLRLTFAFSDIGTVVNIRIRGEDTADAAAFSTFVDFTGRPETTAFVDWDNVDPGEAGVVASTPDISPVIQEIVDGGSWASGNDIVIFLDDNGSDLDAYRRMGAWNNFLYRIPSIEIIYTDGIVIETVGTARTCENANFISNRRSGIITHIFRYDDSAATFSTNLLASALPITLLPSPPAVDDIVYFISQVSNSWGSPIAGIALDLLTAMSGVTSAEIEYYDGVNWVNLAAAMAPYYTNLPFAIEGVSSIHAKQPTDMETVTINGVEGWAIRVRVTAVGASPVAPVQQNQYPYAIGWNEILISDQDLGGDLPPLLDLTIYNRADHSDGLILVSLAISRIIMGSRSVERGDFFTSVINLGDIFNPDGITVTVGADTTFEDEPTASTGRAAVFDPGGAASIAQRVLVTMNDDLTQHYKGVFKPYLRVKQMGGAAGDMGVRLRVGLYSASNIFYTSDTALTTAIDEDYELLEFREITLPPNIDIIKANEPLAGVIFSIDALNTNATPPDLVFMDLILIPVDEFSFDVSDVNNTGDSILGNPDGANRALEINSASRLKRIYSATLMLEQGLIPVLNYAINANGPISIQPKGDQKLHFVFARANAGNGWYSYPENVVSIQAAMQKRYFSSRGNN